MFLALLIGQASCSLVPKVLYIVLSQTGHFHAGLANQTVQLVRYSCHTASSQCSLGASTPPYPCPSLKSSSPQTSSLPTPPLPGLSSPSVGHSCLPSLDFLFPPVEPCANFLKHQPSVEWIMILNENTDFLLARYYVLWLKDWY